MANKESISDKTLDLSLSIFHDPRPWTLFRRCQKISRGIKLSFNAVSGHTFGMEGFESNMLEITAILSVVVDVSIEIHVYVCYTLCFTSAVVIS